MEKVFSRTSRSCPLPDVLYAFNPSRFTAEFVLGNPERQRDSTERFSGGTSPELDPLVGLRDYRSRS